MSNKQTTSGNNSSSGGRNGSGLSSPEIEMPASGSRERLIPSSFAASSSNASGSGSGSLTANGHPHYNTLQNPTHNAANVSDPAANSHLNANHPRNGNGDGDGDGCHDKDDDSSNAETETDVDIDTDMDTTASGFGMSMATAATATTATTAATSVGITSIEMRNGNVGDGKKSKSKFISKSKSKPSAFISKQPCSESKFDWQFSIPHWGITLPPPPPSPSNTTTQNQHLHLHLHLHHLDNNKDASNFYGWKYSNRSTNWTLTSKNILMLTYTCAEQALLSYTNTFIGKDYVQRLCKRVKCRKGGSGNGGIGNGGGGGGAHACGRKKTVYRECYDAEDIIQVKFLSGHDVDLDLRAFQDTSIPAKTETETDDGGDDGDDDDDDDGGETLGKSRCYAIQIVLKNKAGNERRFNATPSPIRPPTNAGVHGSSISGGGDRNRISNNGERGSQEAVTNRLDLIPGNGSKVLKEHGFVKKGKDGMDDGIPLPPWSKQNDNGCDEEGNDINDDDHHCGNSNNVYGPIVTFLMPEVDVDVNAEGGYMTNRAPPILWKVQFPPDPSIAIEAFTVLDGALDVHPDSDSVSNSTSGESRNADGRNSTCLYTAASADSNHNNSNRNNSKKKSVFPPHWGLMKPQKLSSSYISDDEDDECEALHPTNIYLNGYQSWSFAGSVTQGDEQPKSAMPDFLSKAFNFGAEIPPPHTVEEEVDMRFEGEQQEVRRKRSAEMNASSSFHDLTYYKSDFYTCITCNQAEDALYSGDDNGPLLDSGNDNNNNINSAEKLDENGGPAMVLGFLSQRKSYGLVTFDSDLCCVAMHASLQGIIASSAVGICTDWAYCQILPGDYYDEEPMVDFLNSVCAHNLARPLQAFPPLTGWCSWYHYYENIDSATLKENFEELANLKSKITSDAVIVDDGYMTAWGDWTSLKPKGFPNNSGGMKGLADSITNNGMIPGVWMAPYACDKNSKLAKEHPDWIIRNDQGRLANSSNCGKFFYGLDATNPAVREYAFTCIQRAVKNWGYKVLKLDFLYAACLAGNGKYDMSMTRAETMHLALQTLRAAAGPDTFIIGCGCPIGPAIGLIDANRISADTGPTWYPDFPLPWWDHATLPSLRAMVRNTISRSCLGHRFWHNDPDCILLGDTTRLTDVEVKSAATVIAMTGGMLLLSDDLSKLSNERLRVASRISPVTGVTGVTLDLHNTSESGIPSLLRLWCTDEIAADFMNTSSIDMASNNAKRSSYSSEMTSWDNRSNRNRNCIPVVKGLGTWSILSLSNWLDKPSDVSVPFSASLRVGKAIDEQEELQLGYHVFSFWSSKYAWVATNQSSKNIRKKLGPHESEIFHVKPVSLNQGQYIGSELHFTCGYEVVSFHSTSAYIDLQLRNEMKRSGFVYLYLPSYSNSMKVTMSGMTVRGEIVFRTPKIGYNNSFYGGQVVRVWVVINGNKSPDDGRVTVKI